MTFVNASIEYFFSFRSPYSYLSAERAFALAARYRIELVWRGVRPMAMRGQPLPRSKQFYILRDAAREATRLGLPFGNIYDPLGEGVWRCLTIAEHAQTQNKLAPFVIAASRASWAEGINVAEDAPLQKICEGAGLQWSECCAAIGNKDYRQRVEDNTARLGELGQWGVPTFVFGKDCFWGQDRIEDLELVLRDAGLDKREEKAA